MASAKDPRRAPKGEVVACPYGHLDICVGAPFEHVVANRFVFLDATCRSPDGRESA